MAFNVQARLILSGPTQRNVNQIITNLNKQFRAGVNANVGVNINAADLKKLKDLGKATGTLKRELDSSSKSARGFADAIGLAARRFSAYVLATSAFIKLSSAFKSSLSDAIQFQRELVRVAQVTGDSLSGLTNLTKTIDRLSTTLGTNSNKLLETSRILAQTGLSAKDTEVALAALAKSTLAPTFGEITETAEVAIATLRQFKLEAEDLEGVLGSINAISKSFAVESQDLGVAIRRAGGAFSATGGDLNELLALFTSVRATTRESAESIATGFRTIFTRLQRVRTLNFLESVGIDLRNAQGEFVGGFEAINRLSTALSQLNTTDPRFSQIIEELGGFRQVSKVIPLVQQFGTAQTALNVAIRGTDSLSQDAATAQQALAVQLEKVREEFQKMVRTIGASDTFLTLADGAIRLSKAIIRVTEALEPLLPVLLLLGGNAVARNFGRIGGAFQDFTGAFLARNEGGGVPGTGNTDSVPAMLTPGEFVLRKSAVKSIGLGALHTLNRTGTAGFNKGGLVKGGVQYFQTGGLVNSVAPQSINLNSIIAAVGIISSVVGTFESLNSVVSSLTSSIALASAQFFLFRGLAFNLAATGETGKALRQSQENLAKSTVDLAKAQDEATNSQQAFKDTVNNPTASKALIQSAKDRAKQDRLAAQAAYNRTEDLKVETNKLQNQIRRWGDGLALAASGLSTFGQYLETAGRQALEASRGVSGGAQLVVGRAASSAAQGGILGAVTGGSRFGVPGAIAGLVGGAVLGIVQGLNEKAALLEKIRVEEPLNNLATTLDAFASGRRSATEQLTELRGIAASVNRELLGAGAEARQQIISQASAQISNFDRLLNEVAATSTSMKEFKTSVGDILPLFSRLTKTPLAQLEENFQKVIVAANKKAEEDTKYAEIQARNIERIRQLSDVGGILNSVTFSLSRLNDPITGVSEKLSVLDRSLVFDNLTNFADIDQIEVVARSLEGIGGPASKKLTEEATAIARTFRQLPDALLSTRAQDPLGELGNFSTRLAAELRDTPQFIKDIIQARIQKITGTDNREEGLLRRVQTDLIGLRDELLGGLENIVDGLRAQEQFAAQQLDVFSELFNKRVQIEQSYLQSLEKTVVERAAAEERLAEITGQRLAPGRRQEIDNQRLAALTTDLNLADVSVDTLSSVIDKAKDRIRDLQDAVNFADRRNVAGLNEQLAIQQTRLQAANRALEFLADGANRAAPALQELEDVQSDREAIFDLVKQFTFGDNQSRRELGQSIASTIVALRSPQGVEALPQELRGGVLQFLSSLGEAQLPSLGGRSGNELVKELVGTQLRNIGFTPADVQAIVEATPREEQLIQQVAEASAQAVEATKSLSDSLRDDLSTLNEFLRDRFNFFLDRLAVLFAQSEVDRRKTILEGAEIQKQQLEERENSVTALRAFGIKTNEDVARTREIIPILKLQKTVQDEILRLRNLSRQNTGPDGELTQSIFNRLVDRGFLPSANIEEFTFGDAFKRTNSDFRSGLLSTIQELLNEQNIPQNVSDNIIRNIQLGAENPGIPGQSNVIAAFVDAINNVVPEELRKGFEAAQIRGVEVRKQLDDKGISLQERVDVTGNIDSIEKALAKLGDASITQIGTDIQTFTNQVIQAKRNLERARIRVENLQNRTIPEAQTGAPAFASGGFVGGVGALDSINARLTPGEFVLRKATVNNLGRDFLEDLNENGPKFQTGGLLTLQELGRLRRRRIREQFLQAREAKREAFVNRRRALRDRAAASPTGAAGFSIRQRRLRAQLRFNQTRQFNDGSVPLSSRRRDDLIPRADFVDPRLVQQFTTLRNRPTSVNLGDARPRGFLRDENFLRNRDRFESLIAILQQFLNGGFNSGGFINGVGNRDSVPALLTPGEFVLRKSAVKKLGMETVRRLNNAGVQGFQEGGAVGNTPTPGGTLIISSDSIEKFDSSVTKFASAAATLSKSLANIPTQIQMTGTHKVEVIVNGADVLAKIKPEIQELVTDQIQANINKLIKDKMPAAGANFKADKFNLNASPVGLVPSQRSVSAQ